jgi:hypothetical protein
MKRCLQCAEQIQSAARVCRYCSHQFSDSEVSRGQWDDRAGAFAKALPSVIGACLLLWFCSSVGTSMDEGRARRAATAAAAPVADVKQCEAVLSQGEKARLIRERPSERRINVDERLWAELPASAKEGMLLALACTMTGGRPLTGLDNAVAYGWRSGKRLVMATEVGVSFE